LRSTNTFTPPVTSFDGLIADDAPLARRYVA
jgi:hypothetical protein